MTDHDHPSSKIDLGDEVRDLITGFKGIVIARTHWLYGCDRITIQPSTLTENGKPTGTESFDEPQLELLRKGAVKDSPPTPTSSRPGGPRAEPTRNEI